MHKRKVEVGGMMEHEPDLKTDQSFSAINLMENMCLYGHIDVSRCGKPPHSSRHIPVI